MRASEKIQGIVTEVKSVDTVEGIISSVGSQTTPAIGKRMLLKIVDEQQASEFLAEIIEIKPIDPTLEYVDSNQLANLLSPGSLRAGIRTINEAINIIRERIIGKLRLNWRVRCRILGRMLREKINQEENIRLEPSYFPVTPYSVIMALSDDELNKLFTPKGKSIYLGEHSLYKGTKVILDHRKLDHHLAILSQTGGGKTETAKRIAYELHRIGVPVLVIDPSGQYSGLKPPSSKTISLLEKIIKEDPSLSKLKITLLVPPMFIYRSKNKPLSLLLKRLLELSKSNILDKIFTIKKFTDDGIMRIEEKSDFDKGEIKYKPSNVNNFKLVLDEAPILIIPTKLSKQLRRVIIERLRRGVTAYFDAIIHDAASILNKEKEANAIIEHNGVEYYDIIEIYRHFPHAKLLGAPYHYHVSSVESVKRDLRLIAELADEDLNADKVMSIIKRMLSPGSVTIYDYLITNRDETPIVTWLLNEIYENCVSDFQMEEELGYWPRMMIFLEEAHRFAPADKEEAESSYSILSVRRIATEGRKFGLGLCLISQRPARLDSTTLSQAGTTIALRIRNPIDQKYIRDSCETILEEDVRLLPELQIGEAIVSGIAVPEPRIPIRVRVEALS